MNSFFEWLSRCFDSWKFWIVVPAWDVAIRVRLGKTAAALMPGLHFRIPLVDEITLVNTRQRISTTAPVDTDLGDGRVLSQHVSYAWRISDPLLCAMTFTIPETSISLLIQGGLIARKSEATIAAEVREELNGTGVCLEDLRITSKATVRALRILNNAWGLSSGCGATGAVGEVRI